jgi:hypothetical protein
VLGVRTGRGLHIWAALLLLCVGYALTACTATSAPPNLPSGTYSSDAYHFRVDYPSGWHVTVFQSGSSTIPLSLQITHTATFQASGSLVSTLTVTVFNAHDPNGAKSIAALEQEVKLAHSPLQVVSLSGHTAYMDSPTARQPPGNQPAVTHTDYYLLTPAYEYQITTDAIAGDKADAALHAMVMSFTLTG